MVHILFDPSSTGYDSTVFIFQKGGGNDGGGGGLSSPPTSSAESNGTSETAAAEQNRDDRFNINGPGSYFFTGSPPFQRGYGNGRLYHRRGSLAAYQRLFSYRQKGSGIGDILRGLWRILFPVIRKAGHTIGREGVLTGERILDKLTQGENLKQAVVAEGKRGVDNLLSKAGLPKQFGTGVRHHRRRIQSKKKAKTPILPSHQTLIGRAVKAAANPPLALTGKNDKSFVQKRKKIRSDTFGFY